MYDGGWVQRFYFDAAGAAAQHEALDAIFSGRVGGPWAILGRFVARQLDTRVVPFELDDRGREKRLTIPSVLETTVTALPGADGLGDAVLANLHNVIHGPVHTLARGGARHHDADLGFETARTHALYSRFAWSG